MQELVISYYTPDIISSAYSTIAKMLIDIGMKGVINGAVIFPSYLHQQTSLLDIQ